MEMWMVTNGVGMDGEVVWILWGSPHSIPGLPFSTWIVGCLVISGPVSLTRTGLDLNCKRLQKNWTAVPVHQRFESVAVPVYIFWQNFKNCEKLVWTGFEPHTLGALIALDYSSKTHQRSPKIVKKWMRYGQHNLRWLFCQHSTEILYFSDQVFNSDGAWLILTISSSVQRPRECVTGHVNSSRSSELSYNWQLSAVKLL